MSKKIIFFLFCHICIVQASQNKTPVKTLDQLEKAVGEVQNKHTRPTIPVYKRNPQSGVSAHRIQDGDKPKSQKQPYQEKK